MIAYVTPKKNQSIYDLCLQVYGTLDLLVKFCNDNGVTDIDTTPHLSRYQYDTALVAFEGNKNVYTTDAGL